MQDSLMMSMDDFAKDGFKIMVEATKSSNSLPVGGDWAYYNVHDSFKRFLDDEGDRILRIMNHVLHKQDIEESIRNRDLHEKTELIVEANDTVLEKVANNIDELNGIRKKPSDLLQIQTVSAQLPINGSWNRLNKATFLVNQPSKIPAQTNLKSVTLLTAKNIVKPQKFFKDKIDNSNDHPWVPRITEKPNSLKPLAILPEETELGPVYSHPYEFELERFKPPEQLKKVKPILPKPLEETPLHEINTPKQLNDLLGELRKHSEIAIDLEHHSYRTFMGITCLMQISTPDADYIIDTLALRDQLSILNEVFTKPTIVKVFHGAILDIEWLQRDLSLYVVNMFDTHIAAKQLEYQGLSLSYLMTKFCKIRPNKHFQLADWRIRPLPDELKTYARMDTHYLIYIYHMLRNELLQKANGEDNLLTSVINKSTQLCMKRYMKPILKEDSYLDFYRKCKRIFDNRQMYALKELYRWRDSIAREEDESTGYVLPNHMLLQISETLPREMQGILACCNPIPILVRSNLLELHQFILRAREQPVVKPILKEGNRSRGSTLQIFRINIESALHCPHDTSKQSEFRDDLPTLLSDKLNDSTSETHLLEVDKSILVEKQESSLSIFDIDDLEEEDYKRKAKKVRKLKFLGPFERYTLVKPYIAAQEAKEMENQNESKENEGRSNEERIASLHEHFKTVAQLIPQQMPDKVTFLTDDTVVDLTENSCIDLEAAVTESETRSEPNQSRRKRKRDVSEEVIVSEINSDLPTNSNITRNENKKKPIKKRWRKRKHKEDDNINQMGKRKYKEDDNINKMGKCKHEENNSIYEMYQMLNSNQHHFPQENRIHPPKRKKQDNQQHYHQDNEFVFNNSDKQLTKRQRRNLNRANKFKQKRQYKREKKQHLQGNNKEVEQKDSFKPFDYSSVDYTQFKSEEMGINKNNIQSKFKGKGRNKKKGNKQNKSMTFRSSSQGHTKKWI